MDKEAVVHIHHGILLSHWNSILNRTPYYIILSSLSLILLKLDHIEFTKDCWQKRKYIGTKLLLPSTHIWNIPNALQPQLTTDCYSKVNSGTSLVANAGDTSWSLVQDDSTCLGATKLWTTTTECVLQSPGATTAKSLSHNYWGPHALEPVLHKRSHCNE